MLTSKARPKKRILIVNCYFDTLRISIQRKMKIPFTMTPAYLAGVFDPNFCDIKLYDEVYSGPLEDERILSFPDMLILTGLNVAFDRMLHITAYVKTKNKYAIVVAGGPAIRALPKYSNQFFDYCCTGDIEELRKIIENEFGPDYVSRTFIERGWISPRYDLAYWMKLFAYVESSRNCYFQCNYCSLTAEKGRYYTYDLEYIRHQIIKLGKKRLIHFIDNNFSSNDKKFQLKRFELLNQLHENGFIRRWAAEVTSDFFLDDENLKFAAKSGCGGLFCGVESFNRSALLNFKKYQNTRMPQIKLIKKCLHANIPFHYGIVFDLSTRKISDLSEELDFILDTPEIPLPSFITLAIPLLKTPFFYKCVENNMFLPNLKLRDLDGSTITLKSKDSLSDAVQFLIKIQYLKGYKSKIIKHMKDFYKMYKNVVSIDNIAISQYGSLALIAPRILTLGFNINTILKYPVNNKQTRTFIGSTEQLDPVYRPAFPIDPRYKHYFKPTRLTDENGNICAALKPDLLYNN